MSLPLAMLLLASTASAQSVIDNLSFGQRGPLPPQGQGIPGWQPSSVNHDLQVMSDRIILTPPVPGMAKGALWAENPTTSTEWTADLDFRASGQETGSGNLQVWFTPNKDAVGIHSVYNVENFNGLALVIDQYGGRGGVIRGFLNDNTRNFRTHSSLESLAFGHCEYAYRNLGRFSKLRLSHGSSGLSVSIDDRACFSSKQVSLPAGYFFGITASTGENPDSFEVQKFVVSGSSNQPPPNMEGSMNAPPPASRPPIAQPLLQKLDRFPGAPEALPDANADEFKSQADQFADLHNRLQGLTHQLAMMFGEFQTISQKIDQKNDEVLNRVQNMQGSRETGLPPETVNTINSLSSRIDRIETAVNSLKTDVSNQNYHQNFVNLQRALEKVQGGMTDHLPETIAQCKS